MLRSLYVLVLGIVGVLATVTDVLPQQSELEDYVLIHYSVPNEPEDVGGPLAVCPFPKLCRHFSLNSVASRASQD